MAQVDIEPQASNPEKQVCYFNQPRDVFMSNKIKAGNFSNGIYFKINQDQGKDETSDTEKPLIKDGVTTVRQSAKPKFLSAR